MRKFTISRLLLIAFLGAFTPHLLNAQTASERSSKNIKTLSEQKTEKVHLHLDRKIFSPGEDIWFKAYLVEGTFHKLTASSNNLHVELIAADGTIVLSQITLIHNGIGNGDFHLDRKIVKDGIYRIRAYTNQMRNFDSALFFEEEILITSKAAPAKNNSDKKQVCSLQFYPEGGNLISGVKNRVAFHITNQHGKGQKAEIVLYNNAGEEILKAKTVHNGMGQFIFTPTPNETYYAKYSSASTENKKVDLPQQMVGYSILVGNQFNSLLDFDICTSPENVKKQKVSYLIQSRGQLFSSNTIRINDTKTRVRIDKEEMPGGISSITVFDENGVPVCERLVYNQLTPKLQVAIKADKKHYENREKVTLEIETLNEKGKPTSASLSMAVVAENIIDTQNRVLKENPGIQASLLLNADLEGHIENPAYYFCDFDKSKHFELDLALLTHGWRKYVWKKKVTSPDFKMDFPFENGFTFTGTAKSSVLKRPIENGKVSMVMSEDGFYYDEVQTDAKGKFKFVNTHLLDTTVVVFQAFNKREKRSTAIEIDPYKYTAAATHALKTIPTWDTDNALAEITERTDEMIRLKDSLEAKNNQWLQEITIKGQKKKEDNHFRIYKHPDQVIEVKEDLLGYNSVFEILRGRLVGGQIYGQCPDMQIIIRGNKTLDKNDDISKSSAKYLLDGMFVESEIMCSIHPSQIDKIEILKSNQATIFGNRAMNGIIAVYTKEKGAEWPHADIGIVREKQPGYYRAREFYTPNYDQAQTQFEGDDYRNTLYWNPQITTGKNGKATLSFFTSDDSGTYQITTEGIGIKDGSMANQVTTLKVK